MISPIKLCATPSVITTNFPNAIYLGGDWYQTWMGNIYAVDGWNYIYHETYQWMFVIFNSNAEELKVWNPSLGWTFSTSNNQYPLITSSDNRYFDYWVGSTNPRKFFDENNNQVYDLFFDVPSYESSFWVPYPIPVMENNCYNYACNVRTDTYAQPGRGSGVDYVVPATCTVQQITTYALRDGLEVGTRSGPVPYGKSRVFLVVAPYVDYHWYRQDDDGTWSHKNGFNNPDNTTYPYNEPILDPEVIDWGIYTENGGYFFADSSDFQGQGSETIN